MEKLLEKMSFERFLNARSKLRGVVALYSANPVRDDHLSISFSNDHFYISQWRVFLQFSSETLVTNTIKAFLDDNPGSFAFGLMIIRLDNKPRRLSSSSF